ncbi:hypothetical protein AM501_27495 [Aneurinibacillus migulanus]|uniref:hypothetical protein n=1 Tax=Aneurinibacillus migulanus TaxID=47500 RepID=UPI0005BAFCB1|nr:hypothetical protein [Aneurinibacillus migulanus]KIV56920.1 hypothetical protein TS64_07680 [Aneurinibacillus migulanus]KPD05301.1 hypothetical protein AM501_27495 [Aneurinibacillus migulanus]
MASIYDELNGIIGPRYGNENLESKIERVREEFETFVSGIEDIQSTLDEKRDEAEEIASDIDELITALQELESLDDIKACITMAEKIKDRIY